MIDDGQDEAAAEKILGAAEEIKDMARVRPADAPAMLEQARHLIELAEQIRSDWLRRQSTEAALAALNAGMAKMRKPDGTTSNEAGGANCKGFGLLPASPAR